MFTACSIDPYWAKSEQLERKCLSRLYEKPKDQLHFYQTCLLSKFNIQRPIYHLNPSTDLMLTHKHEWWSHLSLPGDPGGGIPLDAFWVWAGPQHPSWQAQCLRAGGLVRVIMSRKPPPPRRCVHANTHCTNHNINACDRSSSLGKSTFYFLGVGIGGMPDDV